MKEVLTSNIEIICIHFILKEYKSTKIINIFYLFLIIINRTKKNNTTHRLCPLSTGNILSILSKLPETNSLPVGE